MAEVWAANICAACQPVAFFFVRNGKVILACQKFLAGCFNLQTPVKRGF